MKNLDTYITEKILINKNTNIKNTCEEICDIIYNYCRNILHISEYVMQYIDKNGNDCYDNPEKLDLTCLWSKDFINIDKVAKDIKQEIDKVKKVKRTKVYATAIYFYF